MLAFAPAGERQLAAAGMSVGVMSATQGGYSATQMLLDVTQGARVASSAYPHSKAPKLGVLIASRSEAGVAFTKRVITGWSTATARAGRAPQELTPGLLASSVDGAAYLPADGAPETDAIAAADRRGAIATTAVPAGFSTAATVSSLARSHRLVVVDLADAASLAELVRSRTPDELLLVVQRVPPEDPRGQLLWFGAAGLRGGSDRELTSDTTKDRGLIAAVDIAPTILQWLHVPIPAEMRGREIETGGRLGGSTLRALIARLRVGGGRRLPALGLLLAAWVLLLLLSAPWPPARTSAMRTGALAVLWAPLAAMVSAAFEPSAAAEYAIVIAVCLGLGALSDMRLAWPRALLAPAIAVPLAITLDALTHAELLTRSLVGPNPILGARFYGVGNELKSGLAVLVLAALAAALGDRERLRPAAEGTPPAEQAPVAGRRRTIAVFAGAGIVLAAIEGAARIGAGVGGVILVCAAFAVAVVLLAPGGFNRRRALLALIVPVAGLVALAALDLATAHGTGHFTGSILHARSAGDVKDILVRRYKAAWDELRNHAMPFATALALGLAVFGVSRRGRLLAPVDGDPVWTAALAGGLTAGVVGALVEDSGPVLLVVAVFALGCVLSYLWARPQADSSGRHPATRSRARRPPAEPVR